MSQSKATTHTPKGGNNMTKIRIYGKDLQYWKATDLNGREKVTQTEIAYKEVNEQGETIGTGSEDFSRERAKAEIVQGYICTWDGETRNKGGYRWFDNRGYYRIRKSDRKGFIQMIKNKYGVEVVEFRTF